MKVISFEGIDASGKETQSKMLFEYLKHKGYKVAFQSFPRTHHPIGNLIKKALVEGNISLEALHMLHAVDKLDYMSILEELERDIYDFLILDRYTHSNIAYGVANKLSFNWLMSLHEYIRKPDLVFLLDMDVEESFKRRVYRLDIFEKDKEFLNKVRRAYTLLVKNDSSITPLWVGKSTPEQLNDAILYHLKRKRFIENEI